MTGDRFEELLEAVLEEGGRAEPRAGMGRRVMARVAAEGRRARDGRQVGWVLVAVLVVVGCAGVMGGLLRRERGIVATEVAREVVEPRPARMVAEGGVVETKPARMRSRGVAVRRERRQGSAGIVPLGMDELGIDALQVDALRIEPLTVE